MKGVDTLSFFECVPICVKCILNKQEREQKTHEKYGNINKDGNEISFTASAYLHISWGGWDVLSRLGIPKPCVGARRGEREVEWREAMLYNIQNIRISRYRVFFPHTEK